MERAEIVTEGAVMTSGFAKSAPVGVGAAVSGLTFFGVPVPDIVPVLTCIYLLVMIGHTLWKWVSEWRNKSSSKDEKNDSN